MTPKRTPPVWIGIALFGAVLGGVAILSGFRRSGPLDIVVHAHSPMGLLMWRHDMADGLPVETWKDFDEAAKELRYTVMATGQYRGAEIDAAYDQLIDGKTVREVLAQGFLAELQRQRERRDALEGYLGWNSKLVTHEGDEESATFLADRRSRQLVQLDEAANSIVRIRGSLARIGCPVAEAEPALPPPPPQSGTVAARPERKVMTLDGSEAFEAWLASEHFMFMKRLRQVTDRPDSHRPAAAAALPIRTQPLSPDSILDGGWPQMLPVQFFPELLPLAQKPN